MDAIATQIVSTGVGKSAFGYPKSNPPIPCWIVGYPEKPIDWITQGGGPTAQATFPVWFVVGKVDDKSARDTLSPVIDGTLSIKQKLDGTLGGAVSSCIVSEVVIESVIVNQIPYLTARFDLETIS